MTTPSRRRLMRDFKKLQEDPPSGISGAPTEENIMVWEAIIFGPADTPFEDGTFKLSLEFTEEYPNKPPAVKFISKMFHPNVYADGSICLDILQNRWSPTYDVAAVLTSIQSLLDEPNPNSPANSVAAQLYQENRREYEKRVQNIVEQSWLAFNDEDLIETEKPKQESRSSAPSITVPPPVPTSRPPPISANTFSQNSLDSDDSQHQLEASHSNANLTEVVPDDPQDTSRQNEQEDVRQIPVTSEEEEDENYLVETSLPPPPMPPTEVDGGI